MPFSRIMQRFQVMDTFERVLLRTSRRSRCRPNSVLYRAIEAHVLLSLTWMHGGRGKLIFQAAIVWVIEGQSDQWALRAGEKDSAFDEDDQHGLIHQETVLKVTFWPVLLPSETKKAYVLRDLLVSCMSDFYLEVILHFGLIFWQVAILSRVTRL